MTATVMGFMIDVRNEIAILVGALMSASHDVGKTKPDMHRFTGEHPLPSHSLAGSQFTPISLHTRNTALSTSEVVSAVDAVPVDTISI